MIAIRRTPPEFDPGQLVVHKRYGYRGVVVAVDPCCMAPEAWYRSNQTQPVREQAWYHVLVDGTSRTTYVAESNLDADPSPAPLEHPLLDHFFGRFEQGRYRRNDRDWEGW